MSDEVNAELLKQLETADTVYLKVDDNYRKAFELMIKNKFWLISWDSQYGNPDIHTLWIKRDLAIGNIKIVIQETVKVLMKDIRKIIREELDKKPLKRKELDKKPLKRKDII